MKKPFFARQALLVLIAVFFFVPFAMRGSRYAVQRMKNDVQDWLPSNFPETKDLEWFRQRFLGEQFVVISWDGCHGAIGQEGVPDDERFRKFVDGLFPERPPSERPAVAEPPIDHTDKNLGLYARRYAPNDPKEFERFIGNQLNLHAAPEQFENWGGMQEKWIRSGTNEWVFLTPDGKLHQWTENRSWPAQLARAVQRGLFGIQPPKHELVKDLGPEDGPWYYEDPQRLNARLFKSISSGPSLLSEMTHADGQLNISRESAHERLRGVVFGPDDKQTCVIVTLTEAAKSDPRALVGRGILGKRRGVLLNIAEEAGIQPPAPPPAVPTFIASWFPRDEGETSSAPLLRLGGPPVDNAAIDEEGQITLVRLLGLSLAVGLGLSWVCFRSVNITIMVFLVGGISAVTSVGIVYWTGSQLDAVLMSMPSLVYVLGISGAVHVVNYYRESVTDSGMETAPDKAFRLGLRPCTMAALTTSLGLISLATSNIVPIKKFGCYAAIGVIATLVVLFTYLPAALELFPPRRYVARGKGVDGGGPESAVERALDEFWQAIGRWVCDHYRWVAVTSVLVLCLGFYGVTRINTSVQLLKLFDPSAKIIEDYQWLEAHLGKLVPMEIVVRVHPDLKKSVHDEDGTPRDLRLDFYERMQITKHVADEIDKVFGEKGDQSLSTPMTANTFSREKPDSSIARLQSGYYSHFLKKLEGSRQSYVDNDFLRDDPEDGHELWRISLRLAALDDIDFGVFVEQVKTVVEPVMLAYQYRANIVSRLPEKVADQESRVLFFGYPQALVEDQPAINQTLIFAERLGLLLREAGFNGEIRLASAKDVDTIRPRQDTCIVLSDESPITVGELRAKGALGFDARHHVFGSSDDTARVRGEQISAVYTGLVPIVYKAQRTLLESLINSTGLAFVMIAVVMVFLLRSPRAGLISMLPNVFPVVMIFGWMGLRGTLVDIGSMMTASVAMGVAVDDTIHFLSWFRNGLDQGLDRRQSIMLAYRRVATAMTQTTAIGGIGLSIFAFSTFTPTQQFGTLMLSLLAAALIGDLFFLPALLASPLGKVFDQSKSANRRQTSPAPVSRPHITPKMAHAEPRSSSGDSDAWLRRDDSHGS